MFDFLYKYYGIFLTSYRNAFAYRFEYVTRVITGFMHLIFLWYLWTAIFSSSTTATISGFTMAQMISYIALVSIFQVFIFSAREFDIESDVMHGNIAIQLTKPTSYPLYIFFKELGSKLSTVFMHLIPFIIVAFVVLNVSHPVSWLFIISLGFSFLINYVLAFMTGLWVFWSKGWIWGVRLSRIVIADIFSGGILPLAFFPGWLAAIANVLPFITLIHIPISIYLGKFQGAEIYSYIGLQIFWLVVLTGIAYFIWKRAEKKMFIQGG